MKRRAAKGTLSLGAQLAVAVDHGGPDAGCYREHRRNDGRGLRFRQVNIALTVVKRINEVVYSSCDERSRRHWR